MTITVANVTFDYHDYDARGDTLYLSVGPPREGLPVTAIETSEGHVVEYDASGAIIALELLHVRRALQEAGEITVTCPEEHHVQSSTLAPVLAVA